MIHPVQNSRRALAAMGKATVVAAVAAAALCLAARPQGLTAADKGDPPPKATASGLEFVPADAVAMATYRVADLWNHPLGKAVRDMLDKELPEAAKGARKQFGVAPDEVERVTLFLPSIGPGVEPLVAITTLKSLDPKAVVTAAAPDAKEETIKGRSLYRNDRGPSFAFLDDRTFLIGRSEQLQDYLKHGEAATDGALAPVLKLAAEKHFFVAGVDVAAIAKTAPLDKLPPEIKPFKALFKAQLATMTADLDDQLKANLRVTFAKEADAREGATAIDDGLDMLRGAFVQMLKQFSQDDDAPKLNALLKDVQAALRSAKAEQKGATVEVEASLKIDAEATTVALGEAVQKIRNAAKRIQISNDLKQLTLAVHSYNDANGALPAQANYDKNGKPLLSWRVHLLPYIEGGNLYKEFHLDEPWDSDHNKKLIEKMPTTFAPPDSQAFKDHETHFQAIVGKGTVFEPLANPRPGPVALGLSLPRDIPDGTSQTILFVEAKKAVPWTKPEDVTLEEGKMLKKLGGLSEGGFMAGLCDGSVRLFPLTMKEDTLRIWIIRNSGMVRPDPEK